MHPRSRPFVCSLLTPRRAFTAKDWQRPGRGKRKAWLFDGDAFVAQAAPLRRMRRGLIVARGTRIKKMTRTVPTVLRGKALPGTVRPGGQRDQKNDNTSNGPDDIWIYSGSLRAYGPRGTRGPT